LRQQNAELNRLYVETQERVRELEIFFRIVSKLRQVETLEAMLPALLKELQQILGADSSAVSLLQPDGEHFSVAWADGLLSPLRGSTFSVQEGISGHVFRTRQPYATLDYTTDPYHLDDLPGGDYRGPAAYVPLESESGLLGVLVLARLGDPQAQPFTPTEMRLLAAIGETKRPRATPSGSQN